MDSAHGAFVVVWIAVNDRFDLCGLDHRGERRIACDQVVCRNRSGSESFQEFLPLQDFLQFGQQRRS